MKGIYVLIISVDKKIEVKIGSLGKIKFDKGIYAYVGSAQNNLEKRLKRHISKAKNMFWHIDYFLDNEYVKIIRIFYKQAEKSEECITAKKLSETKIPVINFGCSDCKCKSHFFKIDYLSNKSKFKVKKYEDSYTFW